MKLHSTEQIQNLNFKLPREHFTNCFFKEMSTYMHECVLVNLLTWIGIVAYNQIRLGMRLVTDVVWNIDTKQEKMKK